MALEGRENKTVLAFRRIVLGLSVASCGDATCQTFLLENVAAEKEDGDSPLASKEVSIVYALGNVASVQGVEDEASLTCQTSSKARKANETGISRLAKGLPAVLCPTCEENGPSSTVLRLALEIPCLLSLSYVLVP